MATTAAAIETWTSAAIGDTRRAKAFHWLVSVATIAVLALLLDLHHPSEGAAQLGAWVVACLLADLMYVRIRRGISLSMSLPVVLAAALLYSPAVTALIAFLGSLDPREIRGKTSIDRILFNRSQVALSAAAASVAIHLISRGAWDWPLVVAACGVGLVADSVVNVVLVATSTVLSGRAGMKEIVVGLWGSEPAASLGLYLSMCLVAPLLALIYRDWGAWALLACTAVLMPIRVALARIQALGASGDLIKIRDAELASANAGALAGRRDERLILAGDLHDEVLPALFKVHLMGEVLKQDLASGRLLDLDDDLPELLEATTTAQDAVRRVVGDLRSARTAIRNVARAIRTYADQIESDGGPTIELSLCDMECADRSGLVIVQVAREALVNSSKYSAARRIRVRLTCGSGDVAELVVTDDGRGFDPEDVDKDSHFGLQLMAERVEAVGGSVLVTSSPGAGTTIAASIPLA